MGKKYKKLLIIFLIAFIIGVFGFASSFFMYLKQPKAEKTEYNIGDKTIVDTDGLVFESIDDSIYLEKAIPTLDKFGVMEKGFSFTIKNNNTRTINYELSLVDNNSTILNSDIRYELTKNNEVLGIFTLNDDGFIEDGVIINGEEIKYTIKIWLDYNSEVKIGNFNKKISVKEVAESNVSTINPPVLTQGMIPVYYDNNTNSWYKTSEKDDKWYSYIEGRWANVVTVNSDKRSYYMESTIGTKIELDDINSMWVWIPRFNYNMNGDTVTFVKSKEKAALAFTFDDNELDGFWFAKFESGMKNDSECISSSLTKVCNNSNNHLYFVPGYPFATKISMANMFYAIRKMELKNNIYGFNGTGTKLNNDGTIKNDQNNIDVHMVRNSEWQVVAVLASSKYGKSGNNKYTSKEISNNNSNITGKSYYENNEYDYNVSLKGESASTTGNVTGIYDMSGGKREYVMVNSDKLDIFNKKSNSGFTTKVKDYYYDSSDTLNHSIEGNEPITRGGYKNTGNIFDLYKKGDYIDKISIETNSRACLVIVKEKKNDEKKES